MFDPYRKWLGIPPESRPPTHYQLLAIAPDETDPDVVKSAVLQRSAYVRNFQAGKHGDDAARILNEIAAAEACLTNPAKRAAYDAELKRRRPSAPAPLPPPQPLPALGPSGPPIDPLLASLAAAPAAPPVWMRQPRRRSLAAWQLAALGGGGVSTVVLLGVLIALALDRNEELPPATTEHQQVETSPAQEPAVAVLPEGAQVEAPAASASNATDDAPSEAPPAEGLPPEAPVASDPAPEAAGDPAAAATVPPEQVGVVADRVVLWNTHNALDKNYGTLACNLVLFAGVREVWRLNDIEVPWSEDREISAAVPLPKVRFDRLRVEITRHQAPAGGLSELQVVAGNVNVTLGCPARASGMYDMRFHPECVTDGNTSSKTHGEGYWVLPHQAPLGWVEVDLALPVPADFAGVQAERIVLHNTTNGDNRNNFGTRACDVVLSHRGREVWRQRGLRIPWTPSQDTGVALDLPKLRFDRVRVEISEWEGEGGGLAEIEVIGDGRNLARACAVRANANWGDPFYPRNVVDGITSSRRHQVGYWLLPSQWPGWVEVELAAADPQIAGARKQLGLWLASEGNWPRGLQWLARCGDERYVTLAEEELRDPLDAGTLTALGDAWWDLADDAAEAEAVLYRGRAVHHYQRALATAAELTRPRLRERISRALPTMRERNYLYYFAEADPAAVYTGYTLRGWHVRVAGEQAEHALWMHPPSGGRAIARFDLGGRFARLQGGVAIDDSVPVASATPITFHILSDGQTLWSSEPLQRPGIVEAFDIGIAGVQRLELAVDCPGVLNHAHAVWIDPQVVEKDDGAAWRGLPPPAVAEIAGAYDRLHAEVAAQLAAAQQPAERAAIATRLLKRAIYTRPAAELRFALCLLAADVAAQAGQYSTADEALSSLARWFEVDVLARKEKALTAAAARAKSPAEKRDLAQTWGGLAGEALRTDDYEAALRCADLAATAAKQSNDRGFAEELTASRDELRQIAEAAERVADARRAATERLDDRRAAAWGKFLCLYKDDWPAGLPLWTSGGDDAAALAQDDLAAPADADAQAALAARWWKAAEAESSPLPQRHLRLRAAQWYRRALAGLAGQAKAEAERRLDTADELSIDEARYGVGGSWIDVTADLRRAVVDARLLASVDNALVGDRDPAPQQQKALVVKYTLRGRAYERSFAGWEAICLDGRPRESSPRPGAGLEVLEARYGAVTKWIDVTGELRGQVRGGRLLLDRAGATVEDPWPGAPKYLCARYRLDGEERMLLAREGEPVRLGWPE